VIPDQKPVWEEKHASGIYEDLRNTPSPLALLVEPMFNRRSKILDLGCGIGRDAVFFDKNGHHVLATDFSEAAIKQNKEHFKSLGVEFVVFDMRDPLPYVADSFDVVYANLSLHYYSDEKTKEIVREAARVLKPNGIFAFACKSYDDLHNAGREIEKGIFASTTGAAIHLFSKDYAKSILQGIFKVDHLDEAEEEYKGRCSKIIRCIAKKD
jgi:ubiquinone/menaquinone biosynthesis C-methylase UbiE